MNHIDDGLKVLDALFATLTEMNAPVARAQKCADLQVLRTYVEGGEMRWGDVTEQFLISPLSSEPKDAECKRVIGQ